MNIKRWMCSFLSSCLALLSVTAAAQVPVQPQKLPFSDASKSISMGPTRSSITLKLKANATTGFRWFLVAYDHQLIKPVRYQYLPGPKELIGSPGYCIWQFKLMSGALAVPQITHIKLVYRRSWDATTEHAQVLDFSIVIDPELMATL